MSKARKRPYENVSTYSRFTDSQRRFYLINIFLYDKIFDQKSKNGFHCKTQGEYLASVYGWIPAFKQFTENYKKWYNEWLKEYPGKGAYATQIALLMRRGGVALPKAEFSDKILYGDPISLNLDRQKNLLSDVSSFLRNQFSSIKQENLSPVRECCDKILNKEFHILLDQIVEDKLIEIQKKDNYSVLAALLIFAQSGALPAEEKRVLPSPNIYMSTKGEIQRIFPLEERSLHAKKITIINYAGTSLLSGREITYDCQTDWERFLSATQERGCETVVVLTDPTSFAAEDAVNYKMRPRSFQSDQTISNIIPSNMRKIIANIKNYPEWNIQLLITSVALPCAYFRSEFEENHLDNIKIDLYLPNFSTYLLEEKKNVLNREIKEMRIPDDQEADDEVRQSFMIYRRSTPELYSAFSRNIDAIVSHSKPVDPAEANYWLSKK